jgi:hypothetical protein
MEPKVRDATWLFEKHKTKSEQWWSTIFTLVIASLARRGSPTEFPLWRYRNSGNEQWFEPLKEYFSFRFLSLAQVHVEAELCNVFPEFLPDISIQPDIVVTDPGNQIAWIIENKTYGAGPGNLEAYHEAGLRLCAQGWKAQTLLLISAGNPYDEIWKLVERLEIPILLWEDVLRALDKVRWLADLFDEELSGYYLRRVIRDW